jgi:hypothetical protein
MGEKKHNTSRLGAGLTPESNPFVIVFRRVHGRITSDFVPFLKRKYEIISLPLYSCHRQTVWLPLNSRSQSVRYENLSSCRKNEANMKLVSKGK